MKFKHLGKGGKKKKSRVRHDRTASSLIKKPSDTSRTNVTQSKEAGGTSSVGQRIFSKKATLVGAAAVIVILTTIALLIYQDGASQNSNTQTAALAPEYPTVLPKNSSVDSLGGWQRISPPQNDPVFAYSDLIDGTPISVSQQPLPESFKGNIESEVATVAKKFNATNKIDAGDLKVYIGTSAKGPQSVIFAKKNLLILIKSQKKIDNTAWTTYIQSLN